MRATHAALLTRLQLPVLLTLLGTSAAHADGGWILFGEPPRAPQPGEPLPRSSRAALASPPPTGGFTVDSSSREDVRVAFNTLYAASESAIPEWSGNVGFCTAGTTTQGFKDLTLLRINVLRALAGVPSTVTLSEEYCSKDQRAALMMASNGQPSHYPPTNWFCYSPEGAEAAGRSNLAVGESGPAAMTGYVHDYGAANYAVGHRRWLFYPQTRVMGTGDIPSAGGYPSANANWIVDAHYFDPRPATRDSFVAWPPQGYVPYPLVFPRWSFSLPNADFTNATVSMTGGGSPIAVTIEKPETGFAENTLVWYPSHLDPTRPYHWPRPASDTPYTVTIGNVVVNGAVKAYGYTVTVFDPHVPGPDSVSAAFTGPNPAALNQPNLYRVNPVPRATGYQWLRGTPAVLNVTEKADTGYGGFTPTTTPGYEVLVTLPNRSGMFYRLAHPAPTDQHLTYQRVLLPGSTAQLAFRSRLSLATSSQQAKVQVSLDHGMNWRDIYSQAGTNDVDGFGEVGLVDRKVSLAPFAGRLILLRFTYHYEVTGPRYPNTDNGIGWHFDNVTFSNTEEVTNPTLAAVGADGEFSLTPTQLGNQVLAVRPQHYGTYYAEWGNAARVSVQSLPVPQVTLVGAPTLQNGRLSVDLLVTNYRATLKLELMRASLPSGPWQLDTQAESQVVSPNTRFRLSTPFTPVGTGFLRVRAR